MEKPTQRVLIVAGEASGDQHAARLVEEVKRRNPGVHFAGIGGPRMAEAGVEILVDSAEMAVVGLFEVLVHFRTIYGALQRMRRYLREQRPDLVILTDYPDFNLRLAKTARELGIKVLYYISPQVWAWRQKRVFTIRERVDMMAVVFPFEVPFYQQADVPVRFVGHPLVDEVPQDLNPAECAEALGLDPERRIIGLFPGSRRSEIQRLLPTLLETATRLRKDFPQAQFILPLASTLREDDIAPYLQGSDLPISLVRGRFYEATVACHAVVTASGTATLEIAMLGTPLVVIYKVAPLSYRIMRRLIRVEHIALCNIVAGERLAPELIQDAATPTRITEALSPYLRDAVEAARQSERLKAIRAKLGGSGASANVAEVALDLLGH